MLLELARRSEIRTGAGWHHTIWVRSAWQPSWGEVLRELSAHLREDPNCGETAWWLVSRFVLPVHERIAYSKMPDFTFRFRWEDGQLCFYDNGVGRFPLAAIRNNTLASLSYDLGLWTDGGPNGKPGVTERGQALIDQVFG